jgi:diaminopimelate decarboxylase
MSHQQQFIQQHQQALTAFADTQIAPFYAYDIDGLAAHIKQLINNDIKLWFAVKANPLSRIIQTLDKQGMNFDVASSGELDQVLAQGISGDRILNTGPAKSTKQIKHFLSQGVNTFVVESENQLTLINEQAKIFGVRPSILLRVQLRFEQSDANPLGGNELTPFGLGSDEWRNIDLSLFEHLDVIGLHIFQWGNMLDSAQLISLWKAMIEPLVTLANDLKFELKVLDLGGGLGIAYDNDARQLNWNELKQALSAIKRSAGVEELWLELGRYAVGEFGYYVAEVVDVKENYQQRIAILQGGINHLLRPAITNQPFPVSLMRDTKVASHNFHVHGPLCTSLDKLGYLSLPGDLSVGDKLIFSQCGAYGFTESMPFFLCHELPAEIVIEQGHIEIVRPALPAASYLY